MTKDDGFGNKIGKLKREVFKGKATDKVWLTNMQKGDTIQIRNKDGCIIATYEVL